VKHNHDFRTCFKADAFHTRVTRVAGPLVWRTSAANGIGTLIPSTANSLNLFP
jgi:hypothetical protein